jgi:methanogenic corrinoid protein MtbC1
MVADFFTLCGFSATFSGANTPQDEIVAAVRHTKPAYVALSVTAYYNLVATSKLIDRIRDLEDAPPFRLIIGGQSCQAHSNTCRSMGADMILHTFGDIEALAKGIK